MDEPKRYILDTDVLTYVSGIRADAKISAWYDGLDETQVFLSVIAIYEQTKGASKLAKDGNAAQAQKITRIITTIRAEFAERILSLDTNAAVEWGHMMGLQDKHLLDTAVAAIAKTNDCVVATKNTKHFKNRGVELIDPSKKPAEIIPAAS